MAINDFKNFFNEAVRARKEADMKLDLFIDNIATGEEVENYFKSIFKGINNFNVTYGHLSNEYQTTDTIHKVSNYYFEITTDKGNRRSLSVFEPRLTANNIKFEKISSNEWYIPKQDFIDANGVKHSLKFKVILRGHSTKRSFIELTDSDSVNYTDFQETLQFVSIIKHTHINVNNLTFFSRNNLDIDFWIDYYNNELGAEQAKYDKSGLAGLNIFTKYGIKPSKIIGGGLFAGSDLEKIIKDKYANINTSNHKFNLNSYFPCDIFFITEPVSVITSNFTYVKTLEQLTNKINLLISNKIIIPISLKLNSNKTRKVSNSVLVNDSKTVFELAKEPTMAANIKKTICCIRGTKQMSDPIKRRVSSKTALSIPLFFTVIEDDNKVSQIKLTIRPFGSANSVSFDCVYYTTGKNKVSRENNNNLDCRAKGKELFDSIIQNRGESESKICKIIEDSCNERYDMSLQDNQKVLKYFKRFLKILEDNPNNILVAFSACKRTNSNYISIFPMCYKIS